MAHAEARAMASFWDREWLLPDDEYEEKFKVLFALPLLNELGWTEEHAEFENWAPTAGRTDLLVAVPGYRDRRGSDKRGPQRGDVFLVVEFKRPSECVDDPDHVAQVEGYAADFAAPYHMLCNGRSLALWEWDSAAETSPREIVRCEMRELGVNRSKLVQYLERNRLERYHRYWKDPTVSRNDALRRVAAAESLRACWGHLRFEVDQRVQLVGAIPDDPSDLKPWGAPDRSAPPQQAMVYLDQPRPVNDRSAVADLERAVLRLGLHGGISSLYVRAEQVEGFRTHTEAALSGYLGIGGSIDPVLPRPGGLATGRWTVQPLGRWDFDGVHPTLPPTTLDARALADSMNRVMDEWVWARLSYVMSMILGRDNAASRDHLELRTHLSVRDALVPRWESAYKQLGASPSLRCHVLLGALSPAHDGDRVSARLRLGPATIPHLARGLFFQLVVGEALDVPCEPHLPMGDAPLSMNVDFNGQTAFIGHLLSLSHADHGGIFERIIRNKIRCPLLLPQCEVDPEGVQRRIRGEIRLTRDPTSTQLGRTTARPDMVLTGSAELHLALEKGWTETAREVLTMVEYFAKLEAGHRQNLALSA